MKYTHSAFEKAEAILSQRRRNAKDELTKREMYVYEKLPEVRLMRETMRTSYIELVKIIASKAPNAKELAETVRNKSLATQKNMTALIEELTGDPDYLELKPTCPKCGDSGVFEGKRCECMNELLKKITTDELSAGSTIVMHGFNEFDLSFYPEGQVREKYRGYLNYALGFCEHFPKGCRSMLFIGRTGLGKTFLSSCIARSVTEKGYAVAFGSGNDFLRKIEDEHFGRATGETLDALINADLLIFDDLGSEFKSAFNETTIYNIINGRINLRKPTIISMNLTLEQLNSTYNERITSRLLNEFTPFMFTGSDIRQQKSARLYSKNK